MGVSTGVLVVQHTFSAFLLRGRSAHPAATLSWRFVHSGRVPEAHVPVAISSLLLVG